MEKHSVKTTWKGNMAFEADIDGHAVNMDAKSEFGGNDNGASPKKLLLAAFAGCTGMDIISLLKKMRVDFESCDIEVQGDVTEEHPKYYFHMHVVYNIKGRNLPLDKIEKAVRMSEETYCGVGALYRKAIKVTSEIKLTESQTSFF